MSLVQSATTFASSSSSSTTFTSNVSAGNAIIVVAYHSAAEAPGTPTVSDSQGNTYSQIDQVYLTSNELFAAFIAPNCAAGPTTVTVTWNFTGASDAVICEYSGIATSSPLDAHASGAAYPAPTLSITTSGSNDTVIAVCAGTGNNLSASISPSPGWTLEISYPPTQTTWVPLWDQTGIAASTITATAGLTNVNNTGVAVILFALFGPPAIITLGPLVPTTAVVGIPYVGQATISGGDPPYTASVISGSLPPGLSIGTTSSSGRYYIVTSGVPTTAGTYTFTVQVTDSASHTATRSYTIVVTSHGISKFEPYRTIYVQGFGRTSGDGYGCAAALSQASAGGFTLSGEWTSQDDYAVLVLWDADNAFEHPRIAYLPDWAFDGVTVSSTLTLTNCVLPSALSLVFQDGTTQSFALSASGSAPTWSISFACNGFNETTIQRMSLTFVPPTQEGSFAREEFSAVFTNWSLTDPNNRLPLSVAAPGSVRLEEDDAWVVRAGVWAAAPYLGYWSQGQAIVSSYSASPAAQLAIETHCQYTHDIYVGTRLDSNCGIVQAALDGGSSVTLDTYNIYGGSGTNVRRKLFGGVAAGRHSVVLTITSSHNPSSSGTYFYFDFLEMAVPGPAPNAPGANTAVGVSTEWDGMSVQLPPARVVWAIQQLGLAGEVDHAVGVLWWMRLMTVTFGLDAAARPVLNRAARDWHADYFALLQAASIGITVSFSQQLVRPPDNPPSAVWIQRYPDGTAVTIATAYSGVNASQIAFGSAVQAYIGEAYIEMGTMLQTAGLPIRLQFGNVGWWAQADSSGMPFYDADTAAAAETALGRALYTFLTPHDDPSMNSYADANFLRSRLQAYAAAVQSVVLDSLPGAVFELLWALDDNDPSAAQLNRYVNLPTQWQQRSGSGFDTFLIEGLTYGGVQFDVNKAKVCAGYPFQVLDWDLAHCRYMLSWLYASSPWLKEYWSALDTLVPLIKAWAWDHLNLYGWPLPLPPQPRQTVVSAA